MLDKEGSENLRLQVSYVKGDLAAMKSLIAKLEQPLTSPNWENESRLVQRQSERLRKSLLKMEQALIPSKPARAASARGEKSPKG